MSLPTLPPGSPAFREACAADARNVARKAPVVFALAMAVEAGWHYGDPQPQLLLSALAITVAGIAIQMWLVYRPEAPTRPAVVLLALWLMIMQNVLLHVVLAPASELANSLIMLSVAGAAIGALVMVRWLMVLTLAATTVIHIGVRLWFESPGDIGAALIPGFVLAFALLIFSVRQASIRDALAMQTLARELRRKDIELLTARQVHESLSTLAGGTAHHFNNRLQVITLAGEAASLGLAGDHPVRPQIARILEASASMARLVTDLLAYAGRQTLERQQIDADTLIDAGFVRAHLSPRITSAFHTDTGSLQIDVDVEQLRRAIGELLANAEHSIPANGHVEVRVESHAGRCRIAVADNGSGLHSERRRMATHPFVSDDPASRRGLGLAFVHGTIIRHQGAMEIVDGPDGGTEVRLYLPAAASASQP